MAAMATVNAAAVMQTANLTSTIESANARNLSSSTVRFGALRLTNCNITTTTRPARSSVLVCAAGNPERIDKFVEGVKSDASKNAENFGNIVSEKVGEVQDTVEDVGRDMAAKTQEAIDAAAAKIDEGGDKSREIGDEVKTSTSNTLEAATDYSDGQNVLVNSIPSSHFVPISKTQTLRNCRQHQKFLMLVILEGHYHQIFLSNVMLIDTPLQEKASNAAGNAAGKVRQNFDYGTGAVQNSADDAKKDVKKTADRL